ncbi:MAG: tripartite tricarboxylate transporter TctB family protein [Burkholderiaceae bacterium]
MNARADPPSGDSASGRRDVVAGAAIVALGSIVVAYARLHYRVGTPAVMGPGFFPVVLGVMLIGVGAAIAVTGWRSNPHAMADGPDRAAPSHLPTSASGGGASLASSATIAGAATSRAGFRPQDSFDQEPTDVGKPKWRALCAVTVAVLLFAVSVRSLGFVPASLLLVATTALADPANHPSRIIALSVTLTLLAWLVFVVALKMPLPALAI